MSQRKIFSDGEKLCLEELIIKYNLNSLSTISAGNQNVKKRAWSRLVEDYNSIGGNSKRTEAQLKKCWDNLKSRKKNILAIQKRERRPFQPRPRPSHEDPLLLDEALLDQTDAEMKFVVDSDSLLESQGTAKNIREKFIAEEFELRKNNYLMTQRREEEVHKLNIEEKLWHIKAAKETYEAAVLNRKIAEQNYNKMNDNK